jgi:hypothetical protein
MRYRSRLTAALICAALVPAAAAQAAAAGTPLGFAITAAGFKSYFVFDSSPGGQVRGTLEVANQTSGARTIILGAVDVSTAATGGLQYGESAASREGRWLTLPARVVRVAGRGTASVPFTVRIPTTAAPGEHYLGITAVDSRVLNRPATGRGSIHLRLIPRLAMTVELRLPGRPTRALAVRGAGIFVAPSGASLGLGLANPGNALITAATGEVTVLQGSTALFSQTVELAAFVPRTRITLHVPWQGVPAQGTYVVKGLLRPAGAAPIAFQRTVTFGGSAIRKYRQQTGRQATAAVGTPVALIVALVLASAAALLFAVGYARMRRRLRERV